MFEFDLKLYEIFGFQANPVEEISGRFILICTRQERNFCTLVRTGIYRNVIFKCYDKFEIKQLPKTIMCIKDTALR